MKDSKEQIKLALEVLDLSDVDNKVLVVKYEGNSTQSTQEEVIGLQDVFSNILKDMNKKLRVIFLSKQYGVSICKDCPKTDQLLRETEQELIKGKTKIQ